MSLNTASPNTVPSVVITMAGLGSRFRKEGFRNPKYMITAKGKSLFAWSMESLQAFIDVGSPFTFLVLEADDARHFIQNESRLLNINVAEVIELPSLTNGQATTALLAVERMKPESPFVIYNIDTRVEPGFMRPEQVRGSGWIPCFPGEGDAWSFARVDETQRVLEVREKRRISPHATLGLYGFSSAQLYIEAYKSFYAKKENLEKGEYYVAPLYNHLIALGHEIYISEVPLSAVTPLGTPAEVLGFDPDVEP
jgi:NDP-sugar pyrophosphorylase family protein